SRARSPARSSRSSSTPGRSRSPSSASPGRWTTRSESYPLAAVTKTFHVTTFGCQMNEHDSERMKGMLESLGYGEAPEQEGADLILFNTCSIREKADSRFIAYLQQAAALKRRRPGTVIGVGG